MNNRLKKTQLLLDACKIDALLVINDVNVSYLTKFSSSESWLYITKNKTYYITDFRYIHEARKALKGIKVVQYEKSIFDTVIDLAKKEKVKKIGYNPQHWSVHRYNLLKANCPKSMKLVSASNVIESLREIKEPQELAIIRDGLKMHQAALSYIRRYIKPNITEMEVFRRLRQYVQSKDLEFSFSPIVASGPNSSYPHAHVTIRKIRNNEPVLLDMGVDLKGYKTDLTRMFFLGKIPNLLKDITAHVYEAQQRAIAKICEGVSIATIDAEARNYLKSRKLDKYFGHALGHGVGLDIHENPRIYKTNESPLVAGMIITIEPAVYLPHKFGVRLEEMVLVKKKGCEVISGHIN